MDAARAQQLHNALARVNQRIDAACMTAGRDPSEVHLIVVTKFFPASDIALLQAEGVTDVGENRDQEAGPKLAELGAVAPGVRERLGVHFVGQLQTNKAASVAEYADTVHSVDRPRLVTALDRGVRAATERGGRGGRAGPPAGPLGVLLQVDLEEGRRAGRGGVPPTGLAELATAVAATEHLQLRGLMAVAPADGGASATERAFRTLAHCADGIRADHPAASWISAGMSGDLESAIAHGATHLRVGSAILGSRPPLR